MTPAQNFARVFLEFIAANRIDYQKSYDAAMKMAGAGFKEKLAASVAKVLGVKADDIKIKERYSGHNTDHSDPNDFELSLKGIGLGIPRDFVADPDIAALRKKAHSFLELKRKYCKFDGLSQARAFSAKSRTMHGDALNEAQIIKLARKWIEGEECAC